MQGVGSEQRRKWVHSAGDDRRRSLCIHRVNFAGRWPGTLRTTSACGPPSGRARWPGSPGPRGKVPVHLEMLFRHLMLLLAVDFGSWGPGNHQGPASWTRSAPAPPVSKFKNKKLRLAHRFLASIPSTAKSINQLIKYSFHPWLTESMFEEPINPED